MSRSRIRCANRLGVCWVLAGLLLALAGSGYGETTSTWNNAAGNGEYATAGNWNPVGVPINGAETYLVVIPANFSVSYDFPVPTAATVTSLTLGDGSTLTIDPAEGLTILGDANVAGRLVANASVFTAASPGSKFVGTKATVQATAGGQIALAAPSYSSVGLNTGNMTHVLLAADGKSGGGTASALDLSSVASLDASFNDSWSAVTVHQIAATNGGQIDLSGVQTVKGAARAEDRLEFKVDAAGSAIDLSGLETITAGYTKFDLSVAAFALPALESAVDTTFQLASGTALSLPSLATQTRGTYQVADGASVTAGALVSADGVTLNVAVGGAFSAPNLTTFTGGVLARVPGQVLSLPAFTNVNNSKLSVSGGESLAVMAASYSSVGLNTGNMTHVLLAADGTSGGGTPSALDLSSVGSLDASFDDGWNAVTVHQIAATNGGQIDLSGVQTVKGAARAEDRLEFKVDAAGGAIDLSGLKTITAGYTKFDLSAATFGLPVLESAVNTSFQLASGTALSLPLLQTQMGGTYQVADGASITAGALVSADGVTLNVAAGGTLSVPNLRTFTNGVLARVPGQVLSLPAFTNVNNSKLSVSGGESLAVAAASYSSVALNTGNMTHVLLAADGTSGGGTASMLDLSSVASLDASFNDGWNAVTVHQIAATNGGRIDLSGLQTIKGAARAEDRLEFKVDAAGGAIDLSGLKTITAGYAKFDLSAATFGLPVLESVVNTSFQLASGTALSLPSLETQTGGTYQVADGASVTAGALVSADGVTLNVAAGGTLSVPNLRTFTNGVFARVPGQVLSLPAFTAIDNSRLSVSGGESLAVAAASYSSVGLNTGNMTHVLLTADGAASTLDLSSIGSLDASFNDSWNAVTVHQIAATSGGRIDLSGLGTVRGPVRAEDRLDFVVNSGGRMDLSSLASVSGAGQTRFLVSAGGLMTFGDLTLTGGFSLSVTDDTSRATVGDLYLDPTSSLSVSGAATVAVGGNFSFDYVDEARFACDTAIFQFSGGGAQLMEVGGEDLGLAGPASGNFGLTQLIVGAAGQPTELALVDLIDNGNRHSSEALYLFGSGGLDGLRILDGSRLVIGEINVYAIVDGVWVHFNEDPDLILNGSVPFDGGYIVLPEPATLALLGAGLAALALRRRGR